MQAEPDNGFTVAQLRWTRKALHSTHASYCIGVDEHLTFSFLPESLLCHQQHSNSNPRLARVYEADVAVPPVVDVPGDEVALPLAPPDLAGAVSMLLRVLTG